MSDVKGRRSLARAHGMTLEQLNQVLDGGCSVCGQRLYLRVDWQSRRPVCAGCSLALTRLRKGNASRRARSVYSYLDAALRFLRSTGEFREEHTP